MQAAIYSGRPRRGWRPPQAKAAYNPAFPCCSVVMVSGACGIRSFPETDELFVGKDYGAKMDFVEAIHNAVLSERS